MLGGGAGHIADMIARLKANEALLKKRSYFKIKSKYLKASASQKVDFRKATEEELAIVRKMIKDELKKERKRQILAWLISFIIGAVFIYSFITFLNATH